MKPSAVIRAGRVKRGAGGNFSAKKFANEDEEQILSVWLNHYAKNAADLERLDLLDAGTTAALKILKL